MKTRIFLVVLSIFTMAVASAQNVGINTKTPKATLDVAGKPSETAKPDGVIAPRLTRAQLIAKSGSYNSTDHAGAIVYVTDVSGTANTSTENITSAGYYQFDGTKWVGFTTRAFASIVKNSETVTQNPNTVSGTNTYAAAKSESEANNIVDLSSNTTVITQGFTITGKNIEIPSDGIYEIDFIATIGFNSTAGIRYRMYIGNTTGSLIENSFYNVTGGVDTAPIKYIGSLTKGTNIDFRISTSGGSGQLRQFTIMVKKL